MSPTAKKTRQTHCKNGHPFDEANMSRTRAADDAAVIAARMRELEAEKLRARNAQCPHEWNDWSSFCGKCGLSRAAYIAKEEGLTITGAAEGC